MSDNTKPTVALVMIVRGVDEELVYLERCLASVAPYVDGIYIDFNQVEGAEYSKKIQPLIRKYKIDAAFTVWEKNFVKARNENFMRVPKVYDWLLWLDADDTAENPEKIREVAAITSKNVHGLFVPYNYDHDAYGNVTTTHMVARLVRNNDTFKWQSSFNDGGESVHETLVPVRTSVNRIGTEDFKVIHHADQERRQDSLNRNIELLETMYKRLGDSKNPDPRILYYLGTHYFDAFRLEESHDMLTQYLQLSGWAEERSEAWVYAGLIYRAWGKTGNAENSFAQAIKECPSNATPYVEMAELTMADDRKELAADWLERALKSPKPKSSMIFHPQENTYRVYKLYAKLYASMDGSKLEDASKYVVKALELRPYDPECQQLRDVIDELIQIRDKSRAIAKVGRLFKDHKEDDKAQKFLEMLPNEFQDNPLVLQMRQAIMKPTKWPNKSIAIYIGESTLGTWGPKILDKGVGMSEEAVIQLSRQMAMFGWQVKVFGTPGEEVGPDSGIPKRPKGGDWSGSVTWCHYWEFNPKDEFDVFIAWRSPWVFDNKFRARESYMWIHDVMDREEFTPERLDNISKVIFVSDYHASLYRDIIPEDKILVSGNGIDPKSFEALDGKYERQEHRMLYMSAHERGLEALYDVWPDVKKAVPDAKLDVYYGWQSFDAITKNNPVQQQWKHMMQEKEKVLKGVSNRGRVGTDQINKEIFSSGILAYPCTFPEVYCATLIKAMAGGCYPITSDFAVMKDFNKWGKQVHLDKTNYEAFKKEYTGQLIHALKHPKMVESQRALMMREVRRRFAWDKIAKQWNGDMS